MYEKRDWVFIKEGAYRNCYGLVVEGGINGATVMPIMRDPGGKQLIEPVPPLYYALEEIELASFIVKTVEAIEKTKTTGRRAAIMAAKAKREEQAQWKCKSPIV